jgi:hypothetical protein
VTDTGHKGSPTAVGGAGRDPAFVYDINKFTDHGHRANKVTVDATKALIAGYYQSEIKRSIFNGCSNGGRSVMINAERYPGQFDAYVVGAPFISETGSSLDWLHSERAYFRKTTSFLPADKLQLVGKAVLAGCDLDDGVADGVVGNPLACNFNPGALLCNGAKFIFYQGWADPALNPMNLIDYRDAVVQRYGLETANSFMRVFMVPGMTHCSGGSASTDQFDLMMPAIEKWMDTGVAPEEVRASRVASGNVVRTRPLCAYPKYAHYNPPARLAAASSVTTAPI